MTDKLKQMIKDEVAKLPKEGREAIDSFDWVKTTEEIGKKYSLNEEEVNNLQLETLFVLTGIEDIDTYASNIEDNVGTTREEAQKIDAEVSENIFGPIVDTLGENIKKNLHNKNITPEQILNFILSGGDYSVFLERHEHGDENPKTNKTEALIGTQSMQNIKSKLID